MGYLFASNDPSIIWVNGISIDSRIDANYYRAYHLKAEDIDNIHILSNYCRLSEERFNPLRYQGDTIKYIDISNVNINTGEYVYDILKKTEVPSRARKKVHKGDIILSTTRPNRNAVALIQENDDELVASTGFAVIKSKEVIDNYYLFSVLKSNNTIEQLVRRTSGGLYPAINQNDVLQIHIPVPSPEIQKYIGDKVRKAEVVRDKTRKLKKRVDSLLNDEILRFTPDVSPSEKPRWVLNNELLTGRLEAEYYRQEYLTAESIIRCQPNSFLSEIIDEIQDGPGGWSISTNDYIECGIPIVRGVNIGEDGEFINEGFVYISDRKNKELKKTQVTPGQVLLTVRGTVGRATVMPDSIPMANLNAAVVRIKVKEKIIDPYYLAGFFNSKIGRLQTSRISNGAVQQNMNLSECKSNLIPIPPMDLQKKYRAEFTNYLKIKEESMNLIQEAINDVETLIEGTFDINKLKEHSESR